MANQWFKFYGGEYLSDPKIDQLSAQERSCWVTLLSLASMNGDGKVHHLTRESLLRRSGVEFNPYETEEWDNALGVLDKFTRMKMIEMSPEGEITVTNWHKRQKSFNTPAERQKAYRERLKQAKSNKNVTKRSTNVTLEENRIDKNRIEENRKEDIVVPSEHSSQVKQVMDIFYKSNPTLNWGNKTFRQASEDLIKKFGLEDTLLMAKQIVDVQGKAYAPVAVNPYQMREKLTQFRIYFESEKNKKGDGKGVWSC